MPPRPVPAALGILLSLAGLYWTTRAARADWLAHSARPQDVDAGASLLWRSPRALLREAALREHAAIRDRRAEPAARAVERELSVSAPFLAEPWMQLGLAAELQGDRASAELFLQRAAAADRMFKPAWTLANFYARQGREAEFWPQARRALELTDDHGYQAEPVFDLCWRVSSDPRAIARAIPENHSLRAAYVRYLTAQQNAVAALPAWKLLGRPAVSDVPLGLALCDLLLSRLMTAEAVDVWNSLADLGGPRALDPPAGKSLTNGNLLRSPLERGFDWRLTKEKGIDTAWFEDSHELRFQFDGEQGDSAIPLLQLAPVLPGRAYRLICDVLTSDLPGPTGLEWAVLDPETGRRLPASGGAIPVASTQPATAAFGFRVPPGSSLIRLALLYQRRLGARSLNGSVRLSQIRLELQP